MTRCGGAANRARKRVPLLYPLDQKGVFPFRQRPSGGLGGALSSSPILLD